MEVVAVIIAVLLGFEIGGLSHLYRKEQEKNRAVFEGVCTGLGGAMAREVVIVQEQLHALNVNLTKVAIGALDTANQLGPQVESLAESLQAQMSTIDREMADLRTRVETGPGKRTLRV